MSMNGMVFILVIQLARLPIVIMVSDVARDFLTHLNGILANFNHCDLQTKYRLFVSYCTSYYGSCLWDLQHKLVDVFYTTWRKAIRRLFGLPRNAHCNMLP